MELDVLPVDVPLMICVPFTVMLDTVVLLLPETVSVAVGMRAVVTTGANPFATLPGQVTVTVLLDEDAVQPLPVMAVATALATVLELVDGAVAALMTFVPLMLMFVTDVLPLPEKEIVLVIVPGKSVTVGVIPLAACDPVVIVTVLLEALPL